MLNPNQSYKILQKKLRLLKCNTKLLHLKKMLFLNIKQCLITAVKFGFLVKYNFVFIKSFLTLYIFS